MKFARWISFFPLLPRFIIEMVGGGVFILLLGMVVQLFWIVSQLFGIGATEESIRMLFSC